MRLVRAIDAAFERRGSRRKLEINDWNPKWGGWMIGAVTLTFGMVYEGGWVMFGVGQTLRPVGLPLIGGGFVGALLLRRYFMLPVRAPDEEHLKFPAPRFVSLRYWLVVSGLWVVAGALVSHLLGR